MARRGSRRDLDPDDWFAEPGSSNSERAEATADRLTGRPPTAEQQEPATEDWLGEERRMHRRRQRASPTRPLNARTAALAVGVIVLLLIVLAAAGVFSGGGSRRQIGTSARTPPATTAVRPTPRPVHTPLQAPATALSPGARGTDVRRLQRALARLGYAPGSTDGQYGPATKAAVAKFQQASGLTADGIYGSQTRAALVAALKRSS
jgi:Putative peptidoglycan binding domain